jgi:hypothetical protein
MKEYLARKRKSVSEFLNRPIDNAGDDTALILAVRLSESSSTSMEDIVILMIAAGASELNLHIIIININIILFFAITS